MGFRLANVDGRAVLVVGDRYHDVEAASRSALPSDPMAALIHSAALAELSATLTDASDASGSVADVTFGPPVPRPRNSFGVGLNYSNHAAESNMELPENPVVFTKFPSCICGPTATVELRSDACDYEGELVVVIGAGGKDIPQDEAWSRVLGLTAGQDISDRKAQFMAKPPQFALGKSFDTFGPIGPWLVSTDQFTNPDDLAITVSVNGEVRQDDRTSNLIFDIPTLVARLSRITTLAPGDLIFTGTPAGVGAAQGSFLADGDVIETTIEGIGTMTNRCVRVSDH